MVDETDSKSVRGFPLCGFESYQKHQFEWKDIMVKKVTFAEFEKIKESASNKILVVDFFAPWCGPCRALGQTLEELSSMYPDEFVEFVAIDVDTAFVEIQAIGIRNVPTVHIMWGGVSKWQVSGAVDKETIRTAIDSVYDTCNPPQSEV